MFSNILKICKPPCALGLAWKPLRKPPSLVLFNNLLNTYEARTRRQRSRTRVRRGDARGTLLPACRATSCHVFFFFFFPTTCDDLRRRGSDSVRFALNCAESGYISHIGRNRQNGRFRMKFKKKKKRRCETHCLNLITNPKMCFSYTLSRISLHPNPNFSSLILHPSSLCALCGVRSY